MTFSAWCPETSTGVLAGQYLKEVMPSVDHTTDPRSRREDQAKTPEEFKKILEKTVSKFCLDEEIPPEARDGVDRKLTALVSVMKDANLFGEDGLRGNWLNEVWKTACSVNSTSTAEVNEERALHETEQANSSATQISGTSGA